MSLTQLAFLAALVNLAHGTCTLTRTTRVTEVHRGEPLWTGEVATFRLHDAAATECFVWLAQDSPTTPVITRATPLITSPAAAVRTYTRQTRLAHAA